MNFNEDELVPPTWMNNEFFDNVLRSCKKDCFSKILNYKITPGTGKGDHYASLMFRGAICYLDNKNNQIEISIIIKIMPEEIGTKLELLNESKVFETEIQMYRDIMPKFEEMLRSNGDQTELGAKMLYYVLTPQRKLIVFEDITKNGYEGLGERMSNYNEAKISLEKLAIWHACSYKYNFDHPGELDQFQDGIFNFPTFTTLNIFTEGVSHFIKLLKQHSEFHSYVAKFEQFNKGIMAKLTKLYEKCKLIGGLNVLCHGDFHSKNMMYKYDKDRNVTDVTLVDFQCCVWGSPAIDILYAACMLYDFETSIDKIEELQYIYFHKFIETLKLIKFQGNIPKVTDLQIELIKMHEFAVYCFTTFRPFMHCMINPELEFDIKGFMEIPELRSQVYQQKSYLDEVRKVLPIFLHKGYLDE